MYMDFGNYSAAVVAQSRLHSDSNATFEFLYFIDIECLDRGPIEYGTRCDLESGTVALADDCRTAEHTSRERTRLRSASAEVVESIEMIVYTCD